MLFRHTKTCHVTVLYLIAAHSITREAQLKTPWLWDPQNCVSYLVPLLPRIWQSFAGTIPCIPTDVYLRLVTSSCANVWRNHVVKLGINLVWNNHNTECRRDDVAIRVLSSLAPSVRICCNFLDSSEGFRPRLLTTELRRGGGKSYHPLNYGD